MSWLTWAPITWGGWAPSIPILAWVLLSAGAIGRFAPTAWRQWDTYRRARGINGGTVALAAMEQAVDRTSALIVCLLCLGAALTAAHQERGAVLFLLFIPAVKLVHGELATRAHRRLLAALAAWQH